MVETLIGLVSGIITGTGMGGGTILILLLTLINGVDQHKAQATNLIFFIPTSISSIIMNLKKKMINLKLSIIIISFFALLNILFTSYFFSFSILYWDFSGCFFELGYFLW